MIHDIPNYVLYMISQYPKVSTIHDIPKHLQYYVWSVCEKRFLRKIFASAKNANPLPIMIVVCLH